MKNPDSKTYFLKEENRLTQQSSIITRLTCKIQSTFLVRNSSSYRHGETSVEHQNTGSTKRKLLFIRKIDALLSEEFDSSCR